MSAIRHHVPDHLLAAYAAGSMGHAFDLAVAAHVSMCDDCRARLGAHEAAGGMVLDSAATVDVSADLRARVLGGIDGPPRPAPAPVHRQGIYPGPLARALGGQPPRWRSMGFGARQCVLHQGPEGVARLLFIPPGRTVPEHGHNGLELTLVLQGSYSDETGTFGVGDFEAAGGELDHTPVTGPGAPCICLAVTDAPLRFRGLLPRLIQPFLGI